MSHNSTLFRNDGENRGKEVDTLTTRIGELNAALERLRDHVSTVEQEKDTAINDKESAVSEMENLRFEDWF